MSADMSAQKSMAAVPAILEKISLLDRWLNARIEETKAAENRIEQKLQTFGRLETSLQSMIDTLRKQVTDATPLVQQTAQAREQMRAGIDDVLADAIARARQQANHLVHAATDQIDQQIKERIEAGLASVTVEQIARMSGDVHQRLTEESDRCRAQAEQVLILHRQLMAQQLELVRDEAEQATRPYISQASETRARVNHEIDTILAVAQATVNQRLQQLARSAEGSVELMEQHLVNRVKTIRPQAMQEVESTQKLIAHRVAGLIEASRKMVSTVVTELDEKLDELSPKTDAVREELDLKLTSYLNELQESAMTMVGWLEDRVTQRVDDVVDQSRRSMHKELRQLNDATDKLRDSFRMGDLNRPHLPIADPQPADEHPHKPLSLTTFIDRMRIHPSEDPKPAA